MNTKFKKIISIIMISCMFLVACSSNKNEQTKEQKTTEQKGNKKVIYTTFFPVTDLTKRIVGDKMEVKTIIKGNQEPHSFELKAGDMQEILKADLIIYNGANMESFISAIEDTVKNKDKFLNLSQGLTLLESGDGLEEEHDHDDEKEDKHEHDKTNPHTWLSVKNAIIQLDTIYKKVSSIDPKNEAYYKENLKKAQDEFRALDKKFETELSKVTSKQKYFVVSHAAFNYLANDYGLKQVAVTGISPEDEPSAKQLQKIADFVKKYNINTIFFEGKATPKVAETLAKNTNTKTDTLYTMENLTDEEIEMGYLKLMELNLNALVKSFSE
ncbi:metal ABC transporter solute-binding protein, Zn/Mn family [Parvimonas sp. D9]|uniref:metal ABC transporter solute-binding protein, Zn/Mn family n=1 Tax=Parvimonas sp. D9 TaxID=3110689 RepID=UPI002B45BBCC|nr:zinc ABC transporter substrate-binding protein [Parvimonas sp. D9]MEB3058237.1 zinc ABC transporter substrate-binding protein [Parvimonas sp. D9]